MEQHPPSLRPWTMEQAKPPTKVDSMHSWCGKETLFKSEGPNAQLDRPWEGTKAGHNAVMKASQSSQVACKTDDSQMTCQLSRPRPGSTCACQTRRSPRTRNEWNPKGSLGSKLKRRREASGIPREAWDLNSKRKREASGIPREARDPNSKEEENRVES